MLCVIALGDLDTRGSCFISVVLFGFLFFSVYVICITLFLFFSDCVKDGHGPWLTCILDTVGFLNHTKTEQNILQFVFLYKHVCVRNKCYQQNI